MTMRARRIGRRLGVGVGVVLLLGWMLIPDVAVADTDTTIVQGRYLRIVSMADADAMSNMEPGDSVPWVLTISADAPDPGTLTIGVAGAGDLRLVSDVSSCTVAWRENSCPGGAEVLRHDWEVPRNGRATTLLTTPASVTTHVRLDVSLAQGTSGRQRAATDVRVRVTGWGETVQASPGSADVRLPGTGISDAPLWSAAGALLLGVGAAALAQGSRRRRRRS